MDIKLKVGALQERLMKEYASSISDIFNSVKDKKSPGVEMTGWIDWVVRDHSDVIDKAVRLREDWISRGVSKVVLIGTGGSYIGCRGGLEFVRKSFGKDGLDFLYVPYFSDRYLKDLLQHLQEFKFAVLVISKSGTTLESALAFRMIRELLFKKEGASYSDYVAVITDRSKGVLRKIADKEKFVDFIIEDDIGGRYSTLTAVGLVPMVLGGVDVVGVLKGAKKAYDEHFDGSIGENKASLYAAFRHFMFSNKKLSSECLISYDPQLRYTLEAMKQLFAESEGKDGQGLMPIIMDFTTDLHSVGQLIQDGAKSFFETTIWVKSPYDDSFKVEKSSFEDDDGLDWVAGKTFKEINGCAFAGTLEAHSVAGGIDNVVIELKDWKPESFGYLYFWLSLVAMFSSYLMKVNPFDQPGVEIYKKRMFDLLGKK